MLRLQTIPTTDGALRGGGCDPFFVVKCMRERGGAWQTVKVHDQIKSGAKIRKLHPNERFATLHPDAAVVVRVEAREGDARGAVEPRARREGPRRERRVPRGFAAPRLLAQSRPQGARRGEPVVAAAARRRQTLLC